ncbi:Hpt protein [Magnetococcus marinus MC-1]|uniref:Hpt protein n=1 Tax=Magnetococcus marinus (strain ATCC BAA-1437 / JCM 17883 / MC-1) TaxID=156889 RepID=A0LA13_MAGMM|nr:Hpt domain-containing protein [Magnetococcus marinus]ABK44806.1 Hpt protein [Magnetococcus marinus MC-1]
MISQQDEQEPLLQTLRQTPGYDLSLGLHYAGGNTERLIRVLAVFQRQHQQTIALVESHWQRGAYDALQRLVHTVKGGASAVGAVSLQHAAEVLDGALKKGLPDADPFAAMQQQLALEMNRFLAVISPKTVVEGGAVGAILPRQRERLVQVLEIVEGYDAMAGEQLQQLLHSDTQLAVDHGLQRVLDLLNIYEFEQAAELLKGWLRDHAVDTP